MGGLPFFWVGDVFFDGESDGGLSKVDASFDAKGVVVWEDVGGEGFFHIIGDSLGGDAP